MLYICFPVIHIYCSNCYHFEYVISGDLLIYCGKIRNQIMYYHQNIFFLFSFYSTSHFLTPMVILNAIIIKQCILLTNNILDTEQKHTIWHVPHSALWSTTFIHNSLCILKSWIPQTSHEVNEYLLSPFYRCIKLDID